MTSTDTQQASLNRRITELYATDSQFAAARPDPAVAGTIAWPELRLPEIVRTVMEGYADRPALAQRAVRTVTDPGTGRTSVELEPRFDTITYRETWDRVRAITSALDNDPVRPGDRVCMLGFTSIDYTTVDLALILLGAVSVPLQATASHAALRLIVDETEPTVIATGLDSLDTAVELAISGPAPKRLIIFDYLSEVDDQREAFEAARDRVGRAGLSVTVETLASVLERGRSLPQSAVSAPDGTNPLTLLVYTSGSTGAPKGAMHTEHLVANPWLRATRISAEDGGEAGVEPPCIVLNFLPMSHLMGRAFLYSTLGAGGTAYFAAKRDLSTLLEDLALVRPTHLNFVPRVWEMLFQHFRSRLHRRDTEQADAAAREEQVLAEMRRDVLGGRFIFAMTGSAPTSDELKAWVESLTGFHLVDGYGSTEVGMVFSDGRVARPPVIDYKLVDVPDLGYYGTDRPHPRGELAVKSASVFAGYYHRPETTAAVFDSDGFYYTGDIVAELGPDHLAYLDRRNFVLKLSQGEFVTVSKLEAAFVESPLVRQIYVYGNSTRSYLLAVVVPTQEAQGSSDVAPEALTSSIGRSLRDVGTAAGLQSYEIPRDFIIETTPFSLENGLLTDIGKLARPKLNEHYGPRLELLYSELADAEADELQTLRRSGADQPTCDTIIRAAGILLGGNTSDLRPDSHFTDLGGDSLSALTFANLLRDIFAVDVSAGVIVSPGNDLRALADYVDALRAAGTERPTFAAIHGRDTTEIQARDLSLDAFLDAATVTDAAHLPGPVTHIRTVLLTGATGFLGRYLALEWLERLSGVGKLICLVRAKDDSTARQRLDETFDSGDAPLLARYRALATDHLEVIAADKGEPNLGLDRHTWQRLADTVDLIVDPAAMVNHVLSYEQLFGPNVVGTAELIRLALTTRVKPYTYVSTVGIADGIEPAAFTETADIRHISPTRQLRDSYANGYSNSKWAGEVLLHEAHDRCGLPVSVFRCDMIMADTQYTGQLNVPDMFTRMILSLVAIGVAPESFYERDADGHRQRAHYDGLPVDFVAEAITTIGADTSDRVETYHVANPHDDGISMDTYVDWLIEAGYRMERLPDYDTWLLRFEAALRALPDRQRRHSLLPLLHNYRQPQRPQRGAVVSTEQFRAATREAHIGPDKDIPHITPVVITKYAGNLKLLGLL